MCKQIMSRSPSEKYGVKDNLKIILSPPKRKKGVQKIELFRRNFPPSLPLKQINFVVHDSRLFREILTYMGQFIHGRILVRQRHNFDD